MSIAYGIAAAIALLLWIGYIFLVKKKKKWLLLLYSCTFVVLSGYFLLSLSKTIEFALFANKIAYLGSVFLPMCMLLTIVDLCNIKYNKVLPIFLIVLGLLVFAIVCTTGYLPWYYKEVTLTHVNGGAKLVKTYGPLHVSYLIYVVSYFIAIISVIVYSLIRKTVGSQKYAILISGVVLGNIAVWFIEQKIPVDFEFLAVSYLLSEVVLLGIYWMIQDYIHKRELPSAEEKVPVVVVDTLTSAEKIKIMLARLPENTKLTLKEMEVLEELIEGKTRKEIAEKLNISENTVKTHTAHIYEKLEISGKQEMINILYANN